LKETKEVHKVYLAKNSSQEQEYKLQISDLKANVSSLQAEIKELKTQKTISQETFSIKTIVEEEESNASFQ
jgi:hypothetical protein